MSIADIIAKSAAIMEKSDQITNKGQLMEEKEIEYTTQPKGTPPAAAPIQLTDESYQRKLENSNLPDSIKNIMGDTLYGTSVDMGVDLSGVPVRTPSARVAPITEQASTSRGSIKETSKSNGFNLSENQIRAIVNDELTNFLATYFTKTLTENVQKDLLLELKKRQMRLKKKK